MKLFKDQFGFFLVTTVIVLSAVIFLDIRIGLKGEGGSVQLGREILVEAHGMLFDLILFGLILTIYNRVTRSRVEIRRYLEELDDYRGWEGEEAAFRVAGILKRLDKLGKKNIDTSRLHLGHAKAGFIIQAIKDQSFLSLQRAHLPEASLESAILEEANLREAELPQANLSRANLKSADLWKSNLNGAQLRETDLWGANLRHANLQKTILTEAKLPRAELYMADMKEAKLQDADLWDANLQQATLLEADLQRADLQKANLVGTNLARTNMEDAILLEANLQDANLSEANLQGVNLKDANLQGANLWLAIAFKHQLTDFRKANASEEEIEKMVWVNQ